MKNKNQKINKKLEEKSKKIKKSKEILKIKIYQEKFKNFKKNL